MVMMIILKVIDGKKHLPIPKKADFLQTYISDHDFGSTNVNDAGEVDVSVG